MKPHSEKIRLVFYYPLTARIGPCLNEIIRFKAHKAYQKYGYFIPEILNHPDREVAVLWDPIQNGSRKTNLYGLLKTWIWMACSGISIRKVSILKSLEELNPDRDVLIAFPFLSFTENMHSPKSIISQYIGIKALHLSHYFSFTKHIGSYINHLKNSFCLAEVDLRKNPLYQAYIKQSDLYILPFALRKRYQKKTPFLERKPLCFSSGTRQSCSPDFAYKGFIDVFKVDYVHVLRDEIARNKEELKGLIESYIYDFDETSSEPAKGFFPKWKNKILRTIRLDRRNFFSFDIVEKYNEYQLFVSPEEESGTPSINFIEGMACGCAYLGRPEFYDSLGMIPGVHFIGYNGTLPDLLTKIHYYQKHPEESAQIAEAGRNFVLANFQPGKIADDFWNHLCLRVKNRQMQTKSASLQKKESPYEALLSHS